MTLIQKGALPGIEPRTLSIMSKRLNPQATIVDTMCCFFFAIYYQRWSRRLYLAAAPATATTGAGAAAATGPVPASLPAGSRHRYPTPSSPPHPPPSPLPAPADAAAAADTYRRRWQQLEQVPLRRLARSRRRQQQEPAVAASGGGEIKHSGLPCS